MRDGHRGVCGAQGYSRAWTSSRLREPRCPEDADACVTSRVSARAEPAGPGELWAEASTPGPPRGFQDGHQGWLWATALVRIHLEEGFAGT